MRKSFFNDLDINNNVSIVDLLYEQFYTGSEEEPTQSEKEFMKTLFRSEKFVRSEYTYAKVTGSTKANDWREFLDQHGKWIEKGSQFTRLAVQEPYGVMILQVR